jgi:hypothetical protein
MMVSDSRRPRPDAQRLSQNRQGEERPGVARARQRPCSSHARGPVKMRSSYEAACRARVSDHRDPRGRPPYARRACVVSTASSDARPT